jgi:flagellar hook-associated protein 3 FlgL
MTRVSDVAQSQLLIAELNRANSQLSATQLQVSSGKNAQYFKDIAEQAGVLMSAKRVLDQNRHYTETTTELGQKLNLQNLSLTQLQQAADDLRQSVTAAIANNSGQAFMDQVNSVFQNAVAALNTNVNGQYIFGGTRTDLPPVNVTALDDLVATPTSVGVTTVDQMASDPVPSIFVNNNVKPAATVDDGVKIQYGMTASDLGAQLMSVLKAIKYANDTSTTPPFGIIAGTGAINGALTSAQTSFLEGQIANLKSISEQITSFVAQNGVVQNEVDAVASHLSDTKVATQQFVSNIEDADLPTALTQLQQDQLAVQAAAHITAQLGQLSLLNFLPIV